MVCVCVVLIYECVLCHIPTPPAHTLYTHKSNVGELYVYEVCVGGVSI